MSDQILRNAGLADFDAAFQEFSVYPGSAPEWTRTPEAGCVAEAPRRLKPDATSFLRIRSERILACRLVILVEVRFCAENRTSRRISTLQT